MLSVACGGSHTLAIVAESVTATAGALVGWGTGTVGQLGLGQSALLCDSPSVVALPDTRGKTLPVTRVYAGIVTSAAINAAGDCFVWGDASLGRLGLPDIPDQSHASGVPIMVNSKIVWSPSEWWSRWGGGRRGGCRVLGVLPTSTRSAARHCHPHHHDADLCIAAIAAAVAVVVCCSPPEVQRR